MKLIPTTVLAFGLWLLCGVAAMGQGYGSGTGSYGSVGIGGGSVTNLPITSNLLKGNGTGGASDSGISSLSIVTNHSEWLLFTNGMAYGNGSWHNLSGSSSAGVNEIQALNPPLVTNGFSGLTIKLAQPGQYVCTGPMYLTNNTTIIGNADFSAGFVFAVPTNMFTLSNVMATALYQDSSQNLVTNLFSVGLVQLKSITTPTVQMPGMSQGSGLASYDFEDVYFKVATNFPCIIMAGVANSVMMKHAGFFGPDILTTNGVVPNWPIGTFNTPQTTIGCDINVYAAFTVKDSIFDELAVGCINAGNSYFIADTCGFYQISEVGNNGPVTYTNGYPATNWLSVGPALYSSANGYTAVMRNSYPYANKLDLWSDGDVRVQEWAPQSSQNNFGVGTAGQIFFDNGGSTAPSNKSVMVTNGVWAIVPVATPSLANGLINYVFDSTYGLNSPDSFAWEQRLDGHFVWGWTAQDPDQQIFTHTNGFYFDGASPIHGNLGGGTNLPLSGLQNSRLVITNAYYTNTTTVLPNGANQLAIGTNNFSGGGSGSLPTTNYFQMNYGIMNQTNLPPGSTNAGITTYLSNGGYGTLVISNQANAANLTRDTNLNLTTTGSLNASNLVATGKIIGNVAGATNYAGTNINTYVQSVSAVPTSITLQPNEEGFILLCATNASCAISTVVPQSSGCSSIELEFTNSSAATIFVTNGFAFFQSLNGQNTNKIAVPAGGQAGEYIRSSVPSKTNLWTWQ